MRIILNADDFGYSDDMVEATIDCFGRGSLTSASIMPKMPATARAIAFARQHEELSFGVHLTFVSDGIEEPVSSPSEIPALVGPNGQFLPSNRVRLMALFNRLPADQIERELTAQLAFLQEQGVRISHVDSHGHLHKFAPFRNALRRVLPRFNITRVRGVQDVYLRKPLRSPTYWLGGHWRRRIAASFVTTDHVYLPSSAWDQGWVEAMPRVLARLAGSSLEIGVHPGHREPWQHEEYAAIQQLAPALRQQGHTLIGWRDL